MNSSIKNVLKTGVVVSSLAPLVLNAQQKNVLFIAIDDLKPVLNCYGESQIISPNIDRLANQGVVFENAYCQWSVSGPSRASLLSGMTPDGTGVRNLTTQLRDIVPNVTTLPQFFKNKGYSTVAMGKIFDPRNVDDGHDSQSWSMPYVSTGSYSYPAEYGPFVSGQYRVTDNTSTEQGPEGVGYDGYMDGQIYLDALSKLNSFAQNPNQPFFLAVGFKKPHIPFIAPKEYWDLYDRDEIKLAPFQKMAENSPEYAYYKPEPLGYTDIPDLWTFDDIEMGNGLLHPDDQRRLIHGYYACVSYVDDLVGRLIDRLEETGLAENTIIVLWGDHGYHLGDHNQWGKHTNFENAVQTPLIIKTPDAIPGRSKQSVELSDIYPTLVDLAGFEVPDYLQGQVLSPILQAKEVVKSCSVSEFRNGGHASYSLRTDQFRMTIWNNGSGDRPDEIPWSLDNIKEIELYDYLNDPLETINLASNSDYATQKDSLLAIAENWWYQQFWFFDRGFNPDYTSDFNYILNNPGFELGAASDWTSQKSNGFSATITTSSTATEGTKALHIDWISSGQNQSDGSIASSFYACFTGLKNTKSILSFDAKAANSGESIQLILRKKHFNGIETTVLSNPIPLTTVWNKINWEIEMEESVDSWQIEVLFGKISGDLYLDHMELKFKTSDIVNQVSNIDIQKSIFPNPVDKYLTISQQQDKYSTINLYALNGKLVHSFKPFSTQLDLTPIENGNYLLELYTPNSKRITYKLMVRH